MDEAEGASGTQPARLRATPSWLLTQAATLTQRVITTALAEVGATRYQYAVLAALEEFGPLSQAELGRRCHIDRSDIVATVNDLTAHDYADRRQDPGNRRQNLITLTDAGRRRLEQVAATLDAAQADLLSGLAQADRDALTSTLQRILDARAKPHDAPR
ncbi:MarR family winged helix-turn-helix transcriptional regulator [Cellulomonas wangsupingiae]|uniref:MarR family transcriptional regulator n=1 Tax=Cellulomonas wangsupingiae TaxID=2968085 RepID=A0ABY5K3U8_9CELL|nr:MarR family transcriptional regulator [Cellulomonas wangsupingiae]MCC2333547.1 MarR family transcriptional regulator [Cellulomonas wangsupingiae]MCM0638397.1 MarR family transcriptional regulator [Cellulomonas wangsupingiae]UUI63730.1 MarR family transcriptional regulator [Cellulomonas wangsupingiae]